MLFNSFDFAVFLPLVFLLYWAIKPFGIRLQNIFLVCVSYLFYGWWDWRFLGLIIFSTLIDYAVGRALAGELKQTKRTTLLWLSIIVNLGFLGFFKYFNFFLDNFTTAFTFFGGEVSVRALNIVLPVGISFYTFQTLSYTIDVYKRKLEPTKDVVAFAAYVSFFPQLVAGPIERATQLLPQFYKRRSFNYGAATDGMRQILWGLFKKMVIADNCAVFADMAFTQGQDHSGSTLFLGAVFFAFQIYGDFSGYSDIAIGTARLFGFNLMQNFAFPYFSRDIAEFWRRWHISLSTWFRDYLYIPLGGSKGGRLLNIRNIFIIFIVSGFWHGANWTFIAWGALNAMFFLPLFILNRNRRNLEAVAPGKWFPSIRDGFSILGTFSLTCLAWVFFRAEDVSHAIGYVSNVFSWSFFNLPELSQKDIVILGLIALLLGIEWKGRTDQYGFQTIGRAWPVPLRWSLYLALLFVVVMFHRTEETPFIYFQF